MKLKDIEKEVEQVLRKYPATIDSDEKLFAYLLYERNKEVCSQSFMAVMLSADIIHFCSIDRCRRKLQAKYPELRGEKYYKRHDQVPVYIEYNRS